MAARRSLSFLCVLGAFSPSLVYAGFGDWIKDTIGGVVDTTVKVATAPTKAVINTIKTIGGDGSASSILKPFTDAASSCARTASELAKPEIFLLNEARKMAGAAGNAGQLIFDVGTLQSRYSNELLRTGGITAMNTLQGANPLYVAAAPLAAEIRAAREIHLANAQPLPAEVRAAMRGIIPEEDLARAKWTTGRLEITLPNFIGKGSKLFGGNESAIAVVVDDVIVFPYQPPSVGSVSGKWWWAHELGHVVQYRRWGVDRFAWEYLRTKGQNVEAEADGFGDRAVNNGQRYSSGSNIASLGAFGPQSVASLGASQEQYVAMIRMNRPPLSGMGPIIMTIMVTNTGRLIVVDNTNGTPYQVGWALPGGRSQDTQWTASLGPRLNFDVRPDGFLWEVVEPQAPGAPPLVGRAGQLFPPY